ncbi:MAG: hypothetical protein ACI8YQ_004444 [Polaribacter sp.]|jgi:hypothetical protein
MKKKFLLVLLILPYMIYGQITGYQYQPINGFDVYIELDALNNHQQETNEAIDLLSSKLEEINKLGLKSEIKDSLQVVKIFMDWNTGEKHATSTLVSSIASRSTSLEF